MSVNNKMYILLYVKREEKRVKVNLSQYILRYLEYVLMIKILYDKGLFILSFSIIFLVIDCSSQFFQTMTKYTFVNTLPWFNVSLYYVINSIKNMTVLPDTLQGNHCWSD